MAAHLFKLISERLMVAINERFQEFLEEGEDPKGTRRVGRDRTLRFLIVSLFFSLRCLFRPLKTSESCIDAIMR